MLRDLWPRPSRRYSGVELAEEWTSRLTGREALARQYAPQAMEVSDLRFTAVTGGLTCRRPLIATAVLGGPPPRLRPRAAPAKLWPSIGGMAIRWNRLAVLQLIAASQGPDQTAADGQGRNSPYTMAFLKNIETPEEIGTVFHHMTADVYNETQDKQLPELSLSYIGDYYSSALCSGRTS
jgi:hypothetical protein